MLGKVLTDLGPVDTVAHEATTPTNDGADGWANARAHFQADIRTNAAAHASAYSSADAAAKATEA